MAKKKNNIFLRVFSVLAVLCFLTAGGVLLLKKTAYGEKKIIQIVEVVPAREQAVLGYYIGDENNIDRGMAISRIQAAAEDGMKLNYTLDWWEYFFFNREKQPDFSRALQPYTIISENGSSKVVNNELFKMLCLDVGEYDTGISPYDNYINNKAALEKFNSEYEIHLSIKTTGEFTQADAEKADYIHFATGNGGGNGDIGAFTRIYEAISGRQGNWSGYNSGDYDITFVEAKKIYERAMSGKLSLSLPGNTLISKSGQANSLNLFKLLMMVDYFHDPCDFQKLFAESGDTLHIRNDGSVWNSNQRQGNWAPWNFNQELLNDGSHVTELPQHCGSDGNYIPASHDGSHDNILVYNVNTWETGFFSGGKVPFDNINIILDGVGSGQNPDTPDNPEEPDLHVLEIQPCSTYKFDTQEGRELLAAYIYGDASWEKYLHITYVTPDILNGMTVDLTADYDVIYIGENVDLFGTNTIYANYPYSHIGGIVRTGTLINGLRREDYITREGFLGLLGNGAELLSGNLSSSKDDLWNEHLKEQWGGGSPSYYFLRNTALLSAMEPNNQTAGAARFGGNDITDSMRSQLARFIKNDMPVIAAGKVMDIAREVKRDLDSSQTKPESPADANIYQVLAESLDEDNEVYREPDRAEEIADFKLPEGRPDVKIDFDGNDTISPVKTEDDREEKVIIGLKRSNSLSFSYSADTKEKLTLIIDMNGDGMFTSGDNPSDGSSGGSSGGSGGQDSDKDLPKDFVYEIPSGNGGEISLDISALGLDDEVYQFQLTAVSGKMRSRDRGYFRPIQMKRDIKVLQVTPDSGDKWDLSGNQKFMELLNEVTIGNDTTEYNNMEFEAKTCQEISDEGAGLSLEGYDLIIFGMGFDSEELLNGNTDITDTGAIEKLREYMEKEKRPVIFTNDSMSYVNSLNYAAPKKERYVWKQMTVGKYNEFTANGTKLLTDDGINYRKTVYQLNIPAEVNAVKSIEDANGKITNADEKIYISNEKKEGMAGYRRVIAPLSNKVPDGRSELAYTIGSNWTPSWWGYDVRTTDNSTASVRPDTIFDFLGSSGYKTENQSYWIVDFLYLVRGPVTVGEFKEAVNNSSVKMKCYPWNIFSSQSSYFKDVYSTFISYDQIIPENRIVDKDNPVWVNSEDGRKYYEYEGDGGRYLAWYNADTTEVSYCETWEYAEKEEDGTGGDETGRQSYTLLSVAGNDKALYPEKADWNYYITQSFCNTIGMDRFGITITEADRKNQDKDLGSVRYRNDKKGDGVWDDYVKDGLQGFSDGALLEYAADGLNGESPFSGVAIDSTKSGFRYGAKNRTSRIEELNPGIISRYPYEITGDNSGLVEIKENHGPYYELSLNRRHRQDSGDVTVWYTLAGTPDGPDMANWTENSEYFHVTRKDGSSNYYLYSKGNIFYTGFSMYGDAAEDGAESRTSETKLFINTIFAALKTSDHRRDEKIYTVVNEAGNTGAVQIANEAGNSSSYVCYYDEEDTEAVIYFCMEKEGAANETTPIRLGVTEETDTGEVFKELDEAGYTLTLSDGMTPADKTAFPLEPFPEEGTDPEWAELRLIWGVGNSSQWDGKTLEIQVMTGDGDSLEKHPKGVHAQVFMVCRELFELD